MRAATLALPTHLHRSRATRTLLKRSLATSDCLDLLPPQFLRASDPVNYDPTTQQRTDALFHVDNGKPIRKQFDPPIIRRYSMDDIVYHIDWSDGHQSTLHRQFVDETVQRWQGSSSAQKPWTGWTEDKLRQQVSLNYAHVLEDGVKDALGHLYEHGILLVTNTPVDDHGAGIAALASALGGGKVKNNTTILHHYRHGQRPILLERGTDGPLRTLYGTVWSTTSSGQVQGASVADSAYGHEGLPLHTDMTYHRDPPGLQIFTMVQPAMAGGASIFGDGLAAAERLRLEHPEAFTTLSTVIRRYRSVDYETGWHLEASGKVIALRENGQVAAIRHNDLDRLPDLPPPQSTRVEQDAFYKRLQEAHVAWDVILGDDEIRLVVNMQRGDTMVVANQRCFHGRYSFQAGPDAPRTVMGCYVSQDELSSRFRMEGYDAY